MEEAPAGLEFIETVVNVRYAETDQMGVVYYANYLVWFEVGRVAWCRAKGFHYRDMERDEGKFMVVAEVNCRYRAPARFDDNILIRTAVSGATDRVIHFRYEILNEKTGQMLANGESVHVVTGPDLRPSRLPERYRSIFGLHRTPSPRL
jgi:acyl-CoA thioester hydrolase